MRFGVVPLGSVKGVYAWLHSTLEEAQATAETLCRENNVEVVIMERVGTYKPHYEWEPFAANSEELKK